MFGRRKLREDRDRWRDRALDAERTVRACRVEVSDARAERDEVKRQQSEDEVAHATAIAAAAAREGQLRDELRTNAATFEALKRKIVAVRDCWVIEFGEQVVHELRL